MSKLTTQKVDGKGIVRRNSGPKMCPRTLVSNSTIATGLGNTPEGRLKRSLIPVAVLWQFALTVVPLEVEPLGDRWGTQLGTRKEVVVMNELETTGLP